MQLDRIGEIILPGFALALLMVSLVSAQQPSTVVFSSTQSDNLFGTESGLPQKLSGPVLMRGEQSRCFAAVTENGKLKMTYRPFYGNAKNPTACGFCGTTKIDLSIPEATQNVIPLTFELTCKPDMLIITNGEAASNSPELQKYVDSLGKDGMSALVVELNRFNVYQNQGGRPKADPAFEGLKDYARKKWSSEKAVGRPYSDAWVKPIQYLSGKMISGQTEDDWGRIGKYVLILGGPNTVPMPDIGDYKKDSDDPESPPKAASADEQDCVFSTNCKVPSDQPYAVEKRLDANLKIFVTAVGRIPFEGAPLAKKLDEYAQMHRFHAANQKAYPSFSAAKTHLLYDPCGGFNKDGSEDCFIGAYASRFCRDNKIRCYAAPPYCEKSKKLQLEDGAPVKTTLLTPQQTQCIQTKLKNDVLDAGGVFGIYMHGHGDLYSALGMGSIDKQKVPIMSQIWDSAIREGKSPHRILVSWGCYSGSLDINNLGEAMARNPARKEPGGTARAFLESSYASVLIAPTRNSIFRLKSENDPTPIDPFPALLQKVASCKTTIGECFFLALSTYKNTMPALDINSAANLLKNNEELTLYGDPSLPVSTKLEVRLPELGTRKPKSAVATGPLEKWDKPQTA